MKVLSSVVKQEVIWPNGKKTVYYVEIASKEMLKGLFSKSDEIQSKLSGLFKGEKLQDDSVDRTAEALEDVGNMISPKAWKDIKKRSKGSLVQQAMILNAFRDTITKGYDEFNKAVNPN